MWFPEREVSPNAESWIAVLGRASFVCQLFERYCRFAFRIADLAKGFENGRYANLDDANLPHIIDSLEHSALHRIVEKFAHLSESGERELDALLAAKDARNYFAHKAALPIFPSGVSRTIAEELPQTQQQAAVLSRGFAILARWVFEIEEKDVPPRHMCEGHADRICHWILDPVLEVEDVEDPGQQEEGTG